METLKTVPTQFKLKARGVYELQGENPQLKTVVLQAITHGDEQMCFYVLKELLGSLKSNEIRGTLRIVFANMAAFEKNQRYVDADLNRQYTVAALSANRALKETERNVEQKRVLEIIPFLEDADFLLDIHSTSSPSSPFLYLKNDEAHFEAAACLEIETVVTCADDFLSPEREYAADNFVDRCGGIGMTFEAGCHQDSHLKGFVSRQVLRFLSHTGVLKEKVSTLSLEQTRLVVSGEYFAQSDEFQFEKVPSNFDLICKGANYAQDGDEALIAQEDFVLVFPMAGKPKKGDSVFEIGRFAIYE